jgi:hypothetical protein
MPVMHLLLDHNVPDSVAIVFRERGHRVQLVRDILPTDSPDALVATVSEDEGAILVSCDKDFKNIAPRIPKGSKARFRKLSRISIDCSEPQAASRIKTEMDLIEFEYIRAQSRSDKRIHLDVQARGIKIHH